MNDIELFSRLQRLISIFQKINQLSWVADQTKRRYPTPEAMTPEEILSLTKMYLTLGMDIEDIFEAWRKEYEAYKSEK